jgi:hypothetical protein
MAAQNRSGQGLLAGFRTAAALPQGGVGKGLQRFSDAAGSGDLQGAEFYFDENRKPDDPDPMFPGSGQSATEGEQAVCLSQALVDGLRHKGLKALYDSNNLSEFKEEAVWI